MKSNIGIDATAQNAIAEKLNALLGDENILFTKTRNYHWNVRGLMFNDLHKFFEQQYTLLIPIMDDMAERVRQLNQNAIGTLTEFIQHSNLKEEPNTVPDAKTMIANLLADHEHIIRTIRETIAFADDTHGDAGTGDMLTSIMETHEKMAWMLRSYME